MTDSCAFFFDWEAIFVLGFAFDLKMSAMNVHIVAFETSTARCDVALLSHVQGETHLVSRFHDGAAEHARHVLPMVDALLNQAGVSRSQLSAVAFGQGPGGFTGLRVACGVAQGMAFALGIPVIPVPSLLAMAEQDAAEHGRDAVRLVLQDARMEELYAAAYRWDAPQARWSALHTPSLLGRDDAGAWVADMRQRAGTAPMRLLGDGVQVFSELQTLPGLDAIGDERLPQAVATAHIAHAAWLRNEAIDPALAAPLYVRDKVAYTTRERELGLGGNPRAREQPAVAAEQPAAVASPVIVAMTEAHVARVAEIESSVQAHPWTEKNFRDALAAGYGAWVAVQDDRIVGFYLLMLAPDVAHLLLIAVDRTHQRTGVGAQLLAHAEAHALQQGLASVILEVRQSNAQAQAFYRKQGYIELSVRKGYYPAAEAKREDALVLQKILPSEDMSRVSGGEQA